VAHEQGVPTDRHMVSSAEALEDNHRERGRAMATATQT